MKQISVMIKPASSLCNMRCAYCFYRDAASMRNMPSHGLMSNETASAVLRNIFSDISHKDLVTIAFQGGEPTLAGLEFYEKFVSKAKSIASGVRISFAFQTNGLAIDDNWCLFFKKHKFLVGLSMDLIDHNTNRVDPEGKGTWNRVLKTKSLLDRHKVEYNVLCVLTNELARYPSRVWKAIEQLGIKFVQFIPCLNKFDENIKAGLTPHRFAGFYNGIIPLWYENFIAGKYFSIKLVDDFVNLLARKIVGACGLTGECSQQFVVEADGSVYPCDFYALDEFCIGSFCESSLSTLYKNDASRVFMQMKNVYEMCKKCRFAPICGGGCKRMKNNVFVCDDSDFCGYQDVLSKNWEIFSAVASYNI